MNGTGIRQAKRREENAPMIKIGTRGSPLGLFQANLVKRLLKERSGASSELVIIKTTGDRVTDRRLADVGGKGLFAKEIQEQLLAKQIDMAVHSMKDVETETPADLVIPCMLEREDSRDVFLSARVKRFQDLPQGAVLGTASLRRQSQALHHRPDLRVTLFRGNIDTRLRKMEDGEVAGTFLALAGLKRMGWEEKATEILSFETMIPAVGQGAIGIECREENHEIQKLLAPLHHTPTGICVEVERSFLAGLDGSCHTPVGAHAHLTDQGDIGFQCCAGTMDGGHLLRKSKTFKGATALKDARELGKEFKEWLKAQIS